MANIGATPTTGAAIPLYKPRIPWKEKSNLTIPKVWTKITNHHTFNFKYTAGRKLFLSFKELENGLRILTSLKPKF